MCVRWTALIGGLDGCPWPLSIDDRAFAPTSALQVQYLTEPAWSELLPPPIPPIRPYTLLVDLEGILTCSKWDREHGWRTAKRPGADYFIAFVPFRYISL